jgi:ribosome-associated protein
VTDIKDPIRPELLAAIEAAQDKQAAAITLLDLRGLGAFTDGFLLCTGFSPRQVEAISDAIEERLAKLGLRHVHREGKSGADWVLLDFGGFIVHVFTESARAFYDLERLWRAARRKDYSETTSRIHRPESAEAEG